MKTFNYKTSSKIFYGVKLLCWHHGRHKRWPAPIGIRDATIGCSSTRLVHIESMGMEGKADIAALVTSA